MSPEGAWGAARLPWSPQICQQVCGENLDKGGHYITVWAPRQSGKTSLLQQVARQLRDADQFEVAILTMQSAKSAEKPENAFNVQRSIHVPNLTHAEVDAMFYWYETESGQPVEQAVIDRFYTETRGQPRLVGWFGELLTETYNRHDTAITAISIPGSSNSLPISMIASRLNFPPATARLTC